jgi:hypothetical protein
MTNDHTPTAAVAVPLDAPVRPDADAIRAAFEAWVTDGGKWPQAATRSAEGGYSLMVAHTQWGAWQAGAAAERIRWQKWACRMEWDNVNDPPCHPSDKGWRPCAACIGPNVEAERETTA